MGHTHRRVSAAKADWARDFALIGAVCGATVTALASAGMGSLAVQQLNVVVSLFLGGLVGLALGLEGPRIIDPAASVQTRLFGGIAVGATWASLTALSESLLFGRLPEGSLGLGLLGGAALFGAAFAVYGARRDARLAVWPVLAAVCFAAPLIGEGLRAVQL
jgi:hypothetical protein